MTFEVTQPRHYNRESCVTLQLTAIKQKYDRLEAELRKKRQNGKKAMTNFMEDNVLVKWTELRNQRRKIETRVKHSHEVRLEIIITNWTVPEQTSINRIKIGYKTLGESFRVTS